ncbi:MAG: type II toxin-antitoxin system prevent-host-death family antitoxin [Mesorhizobium sp.]|uniref:type II toxin-antitoxin system prevent-host-death family antitoxin n=1 Tax=Mesorhizobium sp. TaxID=1871066 RepID=UPI000FE80F17|nr:type II toxin-antitoxin system prevent-host-death family antitoxin [Mesorhizobium sp.]RWJ39793.1 MAG: type II toxin-antitoxin system prevent-host-death family antitoxin [Mesorhizobium sp.]RWJ81354.1 MAG: type II toxin-antitoxin system prevent-host-death family antitoxin [Mesorhizobium sp.]TIR08865.1 MAG: type II toxin-antitoxin system prevent-host-death family antitoxin [Mesorhizobium sp.]
MKQFTFSDMNRNSGEILEAAMIEPVVLTKHGKEKLYVVPARDYHRMRGEPSPTKAYSLHDAPQEVHDELMAGIDNILDSAKADA